MVNISSMPNKQNDGSLSRSVYLVDRTVFSDAEPSERRTLKVLALAFSRILKFLQTLRYPGPGSCVQPVVRPGDLWV